MSDLSAQTDGLDGLAAGSAMQPAELLTELYQSLRRMAHRQLRAERAGHSLNTTALVHEAWLKLVASYPDIRFTGEREFLALSGHLMRRVLTDHARSVNLLKRGGDLLRVTTHSGGLDARATEVDADELLALDLALTRLLEIDRRQVEVVELRYFAGFSIEETAELMELSPATVKREWAMARAWLRSALQEQA
jgi:RNA polymerase sigma factor (TIGR02999 family)